MESVGRIGKQEEVFYKPQFRGQSASLCTKSVLEMKVDILVH